MFSAISHGPVVLGVGTQPSVLEKRFGGRVWTVPWYLRGPVPLTGLKFFSGFMRVLVWQFVRIDCTAAEVRVDRITTLTRGDCVIIHHVMDVSRTKHPLQHVPQGVPT